MAEPLPARQRDGLGADHAGHRRRRISFLIAMEWLDEADAADRRAVGCAIKRMIADAARRR
jgi:hypothetical protein